ncbi:hypothetical protein [Flavobacterium sp.]|uniref:hypothetical protein n=1 Tax=Flavobacterium sp. TaxID=239 RepID=UPI00374DACDA
MNKIPANLEGMLFTVKPDDTLEQKEKMKLIDFIKNVASVFYPSEHSEFDSNNKLKRYYDLKSKEKMLLLRLEKTDIVDELMS